MIKRLTMAALRRLRAVLYILFDVVVTAGTHRAGDTALVIRLDAIGDFVIWLQCGAADIAAELRRHHPRIVLLANGHWAALARQLGLWDEVVSIDASRFVRNLRYRRNVMVEVRRLGASVVVQPRAARFFPLDDCLVRRSGATVRIGSSALTANMPSELRALGDRSYTRLIDVPESMTAHESTRGLAFARGFCHNTGAVVSAAQAEDRGDASFMPGEPFIVVAVGAGWAGRQWPIEKFAALVSELHQTHGLLCIAVGTAADQPLVARLREASSARIEDLCGRLSLAQSVSLIRHSELLIANESGPMHIGVWCGVPVLALVGGGHFGWFAPYPMDFPHANRVSVACHPMPCFQCNWRCKFDIPAGTAVPCVRDIATDEVIRQAHFLLREGYR